MSESVSQAEKLLRKWLPLFGFGHYTLRVEPLRFEDNDSWAVCSWDHEWESVVVGVVPNGTVPLDSLEVVVLHELAHGLQSLSATSAEAEEAFCNRLARLVYGHDQWNDAYQGLVRKAIALVGPKGAKHAGFHTPADVKLLLPLLVESMPVEEREVVEGIFYEGLGMQSVGKRMGLSKWQVRRLRNRGLERLREAVELLREGDDA